MTKTLSLICVALVLFAPLNVLAAEDHLSQVEPSADSPASGSAFRPFSDSEIRTTSPLSPVAGYGVFMSGAEPGEMTGYVATAERTVNVRSVRGRIITADRYSLHTQILRNDENLLVMRVVARNPSGEMAQAMLRADKKTGTVERAGLPEVQALLAGSADFNLLRAVVPAFGPSSPATGRSLITHDSCTALMLTVMGTSLAAIGNCEAGNVLGCLGSLLALAGSLMKAYEGGCLTDICGPGGCPDADEPPCTSYTIC